MGVDKQFEEFRTWANQNSILLVEGEYIPNKNSIVDIYEKKGNNIGTFKNLILHTGINLIVYDITFFDSESYELYDITLSKTDDEEIKNKFEALRGFKNKLFGFTLILFNEGVPFRFGQYIPEVNEFFDVQNAVQAIISSLNSSNDNPHLSNEQIIEFGKQLAQHETYPKLKKRTQRESFAEELFKYQFDELSVNVSFAAMIVVSQAETYYELTVKPEKEKELKAKAVELLDKGWTKVKIASELGISKDTLNKFI